MSAQPSPRLRPNPNATPRPDSPRRGDGARPPLRVAPAVARRRLRARLLMWGVGVVTVASLFLLVAFHVFAAQSAFTLERLSNEQTNEQLRYERLRDEVSTFSSADVVIAESNKLGMVQGPSSIQLSVGGAVPLGATVDTIPAESTNANNSYAQTKKALEATP